MRTNYVWKLFLSRKLQNISMSCNFEVIRDRWI